MNCLNGYKLYLNPFIVTVFIGATKFTHNFATLTGINFVAAVNKCLAEAPIDGSCPIFGADLGIMSEWDTSKVTYMREAFKDKKSFNGDISNWNTGSVTTMESST